MKAVRKVESRTVCRMADGRYKDSSSCITRMKSTVGVLESLSELLYI